MPVWICMYVCIHLYICMYVCGVCACACACGKVCKMTFATFVKQTNVNRDKNKNNNALDQKTNSERSRGVYTRCTETLDNEWYNKHWTSVGYYDSYTQREEEGPGKAFISCSLEMYLKRDFVTWKLISGRIIIRARMREINTFCLTPSPFAILLNTFSKPSHRREILMCSQNFKMKEYTFYNALFENVAWNGMWIICKV